jgi:hypothetical protein
MTSRQLIAVIMGLAVATLLGFLLPVPAHAWQKCEYFRDREPRCHIVSDGAREPYVDDRKSGWSDEFRQRNWERLKRRQAWERGRSHTEDMATGGMQTQGGIVVPPFVPGTAESDAWYAERKRRGLCPPTERFCN